MPLSDFATPLDWGNDLDARWPERETMRRLLVQEITRECENKPSARLVELGIGDGRLLRELRDALPDANLVGIDVEPALIEHVRASAGPYELHAHDLNDEGWLDLVKPVDVVFSMQTFHDLGGLNKLRAVYERIHRILLPGGRLLNADFVAPHAGDDADNPRRFAVSVHEEILEEIGFSTVECVAAVERLSCVSARR